MLLESITVGQCSSWCYTQGSRGHEAFRDGTGQDELRRRRPPKFSGTQREARYSLVTAGQCTLGTSEPLLLGAEQS